MVVSAVGTVGGGGGAAVGDGAKVTFLGTGRVGAEVFRFVVVECTDGTNRVVVFADRCGVAIPLTIAASGGFIG